MHKLIFLILTVICLHAPLAAANWHQHSFQVMGTQAHVEFWLPASASKSEAQRLIDAVEQEMRRIDQDMSPYKPDSELSKVNRLAAKAPVKISAELFNLLTKAQAISVESDGAFDITYASVGYQYDYRAKQKPSQAQISAALDAIDYTGLILDSDQQTLAFKHPDIKIDLGGIAKGYAVKNCLAILAAGGVKHGLVSAGGDTGLLGDRHGRPWLVGIKHPRAEDKTAVHLPLSNEVISTSGDYERYFIEDNERYHHIINPKTGKSAQQVVSVSVIGQDATYVDALSTTLFVLGLAQGMAFINQLPNYEAIIIDNQQRLHFSLGLQQN
ncbi:MAG: FAD:protein FMN transferase [Cognaticolwellia sp.]